MGIGDGCCRGLKEGRCMGDDKEGRWEKCAWVG